MHVWVVSFGEPLPIDEGRPRLRRAGLLSHALLERGHTVTWIASAFDHYAKRKRFGTTTSQPLRPGLELVCLETVAYRSNISIRRLISNHVLGRSFERWMRQAPAPDLIFVAFPTIELVASSARYGAAHGVPVVADIRDLWPETWADAVPTWLRPGARVAIWPFMRSARRALARVVAIVGNTEAMVEWGLKLANRRRSPIDQHFPFTYPTDTHSQGEGLKAEKYWRQLLGEEAWRSKFLCCYFGGITDRANVRVIVDGAIQAAANGRDDLLFVVCGTGPAEAGLRAKAAGLKNLVFSGWIDAPRLRSLGQRADVGIMPFPNHPDYVRSVPNKVSEYLSFGMPIVSGLSGEVSKLIAEWECGMEFTNGDPKSLVNAIWELRCDPDRVHRLQANARRAFEHQFSPDVVNSSMVQLLERLAPVAEPRHTATRMVRAAAKNSLGH
jgi:glycosyltransferase involved in cell wall biosynthesis